MSGLFGFTENAIPNKIFQALCMVRNTIIGPPWVKCDDFIAAMQPDEFFTGKLIRPWFGVSDGLMLLKLNKQNCRKMNDPRYLLNLFNHYQQDGDESEKNRLKHHIEIHYATMYVSTLDLVDDPLMWTYIVHASDNVWLVRCQFPHCEQQKSHEKNWPSTGLHTWHCTK